MSNLTDQVTALYTCAVTAETEAKRIAKIAESFQHGSEEPEKIAAAMAASEKYANAAEIVSSLARQLSAERVTKDEH